MVASAVASHKKAENLDVVPKHCTVAAHCSSEEDDSKEEKKKSLYIKSVTNKNIFQPIGDVL